MSVSNLQRSSAFGVIYEDVAGILKQLASGADLIPLRAGFSMNSEVESLKSDELIDDIGQSKGQIGKEMPKGVHPIYLKNSQTDSLPEWAPMLVSAMGTTVARASLIPVVAGSTTSIIKVANASLFQKGEAVLIKDLLNGYSLRNVVTASGSNVTLNFDVAVAPAAGVSIAKNNMIKPLASGHKTFSAWMYTSNGACTQAMAGCQTTSCSIKADAATQVEATFNYEGTKYYLNPINVVVGKKYFDFTDDAGVKAAELTVKIYRTPYDLASEIASQMTAVSDKVCTCTYSSTTGKFTIGYAGTVLSLLLLSGTNTAASVASLIGFSQVADKTLATSYTSDLEQSYASGLTATYDNADNIVVKNCELFIGSASDNFCRKASNVTIDLGTPITEVESLCAESGVMEKIVLSREATLGATIILEKHQVGLFQAMMENTTISAALNLGPRDGSNNYVPTKCVNCFLESATVTSHVVTGDDIVTVELKISGIITSTSKDVYFNFC